MSCLFIRWCWCPRRYQPTHQKECAAKTPNVDCICTLRSVHTRPATHSSTRREAMGKKRHCGRKKIANRKALEKWRNTTPPTSKTIYDTSKNPILGAQVWGLGKYKVRARSHQLQKTHSRTKQNSAQFRPLLLFYFGNRHIEREFRGGGGRNNNIP